MTLAMLFSPLFFLFLKFEYSPQLNIPSPWSSLKVKSQLHTHKKDSFLYFNLQVFRQNSKFAT